MNIIMSRDVQHHYPFRADSPRQPQQQVSRRNGNSTPNSPQSPLDFTDKIPYHEIWLSSETLGSGSFGTVFKGKWRGRNVAVKQFQTRQQIDSFLVEVQQLSCVKHNNIVTLYGASRTTDSAYLIMEYAEGGSLNHLLHECKEQDYDLRHACSWAMQTARGVAYLHSMRPKPIMHRDLKPANLLLFSRGRIVKICDFGTACTVRTHMTNNTGSAPYMAPEVFATSSYLESGDVFSWSIIFWEMLVRRQPYPNSSNPFQILWKVNLGTRPMEIEGCPKPIWYLISRSWDEDPNKRPSMLQIAQEMKMILSLTEKPTSEDDSILKQGDNCSRKSFLDTSAPECLNSRPSPTPSIKPIKNLPGHSRPSHFNSQPFELRNNSRLTTSDILEMRLKHQNISQASTSSTSSHKFRRDQFENQMFSDQLYGQCNHRLHRQQERLTLSHALQRYVESLQTRYNHLQNALKCDEKNTASLSFEEFEDLKLRIRSLRQYIKERSEHPNSVATESSSVAAISSSGERRAQSNLHANRPSELNL